MPSKQINNLNKSMDTSIYIAKWKNGMFTIFIGAGDQGVLFDADSVADPSDAEIRLLPAALSSGYLLFNQEEDGSFVLEADEGIEGIWEQCKKVVWPEKAG